MKHFLLSLILFSGVVASGDYLYWLVDENGVSGTWASAKIYAAMGEEKHYLTMYATDGDNVGDSIGESASLDEYGIDLRTGILASLSYTSGYTYFVELYNDKNKVLKTSNGVGYADAAAYIAASSGQTAIPSIALAFTFVPEPTSGMMVLIGASLLALRRKRRA